MFFALSKLRHFIEPIKIILYFCNNKASSPHISTHHSHEKNSSSPLTPNYIGRYRPIGRRPNAPPQPRRKPLAGHRPPQRRLHPHQSCGSGHRGSGRYPAGRIAASHNVGLWCGARCAAVGHQQLRHIAARCAGGCVLQRHHATVQGIATVVRVEHRHGRSPRHAGGPAGQCGVGKHARTAGGRLQLRRHAHRIAGGTHQCGARTSPRRAGGIGELHTRHARQKRSDW